MNDVKELVNRFFNGEPVKVVDISGFGDFYEEGIWTLVFLTLMEFYSDDSNLEKFNECNTKEQHLFIESIMDGRLSDPLGAPYQLDGISGMAFSGAKNAVGMIIINGLEKAYELAGKDRIIEIKYKTNKI